MKLETNIWETEGEKINNSDLDKLLFTDNKSIQEFLFADRNFIIATKGIGKTMLLKAKKKRLIEQYETKRSDSSETSKVIFLPRDRPYLDFTSSFGNLSKKILGYLENRANCEKIWSISLLVSILNNYHMSTEDTEMDTSSMDKFSKELLEKTKRYSPVEAAQYIIGLSVAEIEQLYNNNRLNIYKTFLTDIQSAVYVFIDRIDQALEEYSNKEVWISMQVGLLEAAWNLMRSNPHVKIYTSVRLEAFSNYESANKLAILGSTIIIEYSKNDLLKMVNKMSMGYLNKPFNDFIGLETFEHPELIYKQSVFDYIFNHTISRPREIVTILTGYHIPDNEGELIKNLREHVNKKATQFICPSIFEEYKMFSKCFATEENRERFFSLLHRNILTYTELKNICREYNQGMCITGTGVDNGCFGIRCSSCYFPFCDLYNIGLLGIVDKKQSKQIFLSPHEIKVNSGNSIPSNTFYILHPCLNKIIKDCRNKMSKEEYAHVQSIHVGHGNNWHDWYDQWIDLYKLLEGSENENNKIILNKKLAEIIKSKDSKANIQEKLKNMIDDFIRKGVKIGNVAETAIKVADMIMKIQSIN